MGIPPHIKLPKKEAPASNYHFTPSYVVACETCSWHLTLWHKSNPGKKWAVPYKCLSWRHEGECRLRKGAQDFCRIRDAMLQYDYWSHVGLTFARPVGANPHDMYVQGKELWSALRKRLERADLCTKYIQTWEQHRNGFPHVHLAICSTKLFESAVAGRVTNWKRLIQKHAMAVGFGQIGWCDRLKSRTAMAGYLVKLARELTGRGKDYQIPVNAPPHFRRLRASQRLLPPIEKNPDIGGILKFCELPA